MKEIKKKNMVVRPFGCSQESFDAIYRMTTKEGARKSKSDKCKAATKSVLEERGYHHRFGAGGIQGVIMRFEAEFYRRPVEEEIQYARRNGWIALKAMINENARELDDSDNDCHSPEY